MAPAVHAGRGDFGAELRAWRLHRGMSQLDLALEAEVSARHVSFLETRRSRPSQRMVLRLLDTLRVPLWDRNRLLLAAGFAPLYTRSELGDDHLALIRRTLDLLLERHEPYPAYAMDGAWNVVAANRPYRASVARMLPGQTEERVGNLLRLIFAPDLLRPSFVGWEDCARAILRRILRALDAPRPPAELAELFAEIRTYPDVERLLRRPGDPTNHDLFIPVALRVDGETQRWMTTLITFGGAIDLTLDELVVECFFPADADTERMARSWADGPRAS